MRKASNKIDSKILKASMKQKLNDACAHAKRQRRAKNQLIATLKKSYRAEPGKAASVIQAIKEQAKKHRVVADKKNNKKVSFCQKKQRITTKQDWDATEPPQDVRELLMGVNVFNDIVEPEPSRGPMVCHKDIVLSRAEMAFLNKGPRFMWRPEIDSIDVNTEIEKAIAKRMYREEDDDGLMDVQDAIPMPLNREHRQYCTCNDCLQATGLSVNELEAQLTLSQETEKSQESAHFYPQKVL